MSSLNENQVRHVVSTFAHVDRLLGDIGRFARGELSPFAKERADVSDAEARLLLAAVERVRTRLLQALDRLGLPRPAPSVSARWSAEVALRFAEIALSDLNAEQLRGYGAVDGAAAIELTALADDLRRLLDQSRALLHEQDEHGLAERLASLPGYVGEVLRALDHFSTEHALPEVRSLIAAAAERALSATFDVGVFGRVSAGKSSLINALIGVPALPVGATPVTAVPIRIAHGGSAAASVHLADGSSRPIDADAIAEYATERENPGNAKGVRSIALTLPSVPPGLRLLDTPGVGSLSSSGPAQTFAWLPRCDLGLVLVAAGSALGREDLALVTALRGAGLACRVLVSKADLASADELAQATAYVGRELRAVLGPVHGVSVHAVSVAPARRAELDALRRDVLEPLARDHEQEAARAMRARLRSLIATADAAARGRVDSAAVSARDVRARDTATEAIRGASDALPKQGEAILQRVADAVAAAWSAHEDGRAAARNVLVSAGANALTAITDAVERARHEVGLDGADDARRLPPLFDPEWLDSLPPLTPPAVGRQLLGRSVAQRRLAPLERPLREALSRYGTRLYAWGMARLGEISETAASGVPTDAPRPQDPKLARLASLIPAD